MKVLIGCPTSERYAYCIGVWLKAVKEIINFSKEKGIDADYLLVDNSKTQDFFENLKNQDVNIIKDDFYEDVKERIVHSRNLLRKKAIEENYDFFFSLEQDLIPQKDILTNLISQNKKIISAYYSKPVDLKIQDAETKEIKDITIEVPMVWLSENGKLKRTTPVEILDNGLMKVGGLGLGCMLISSEALKKTEFKFLKDQKAFDDILFCIDSQKNGFDLFLDSDAKVFHWHKAWDA